MIVLLVRIVIVQMLEKLQREMAAMTSSISKGQAAAEAAKGQYADITKGISFAPPPSKGFAPMPPSKGLLRKMIKLRF